jgi:2-haloacid dehalogenase
VDWRSSIARHVTAAFAAQGAEVDGAAFAKSWRAQYQPSMERVRRGARGYVPLDDLHRENLMATLAAFGRERMFTPDEIIALARAWERLDPWADVVPGLTRLRAHRIVAPCSNGSIAMMTHLARYAGLPWDCILGADIARDYKPKPMVYQSACHALRLPPEEVTMVAAHNADLAAARAAGLGTVFLPRPEEHGPDQERDLAPEGDWDLLVQDLEELSVRLV